MHWHNKNITTVDTLPQVKNIITKMKILPIIITWITKLSWFSFIVIHQKVVSAMLPFIDLVRFSHFSGDNSVISIFEMNSVDVCVGLFRALNKPPGSPTFWCTLISQPGGGLEDKLPTTNFCLILFVSSVRKTNVNWNLHTHIFFYFLFFFVR